MLKEIQNCFEDKPNWDNYVKNLNLNENDKLPDLLVSVLPKCDWLIPVELEFTPPLEIEAIQRVYEAYFSSRPKNSNKGIQWDYFYGKMETKFKHINSFYFVVCRPYQYFVLKLFEGTDKPLSFTEIKRKLGVMKKAEHHLESIMKSFVIKKYINYNINS